MQLLVQLAANVVFVQANTAYFALEQRALNVAGMSAFGVWKEFECCGRSQIVCNKEISRVL